MTDLTPSLNTLLRKLQATPVSRHRYSVDQLDEFLKEAYKIVRHLLALDMPHYRIKSHLG